MPRSLNCRAKAFLLMCLAVPSTSSWAQTATTSLRGTISDPNGAVLPGAGVTLANLQTGFSRSTKTDNDGVYQFPQLPPASYTLTASSPGFATLKQEDLRLLVNTPAALNITMRVQTAEVTMEVKSEASLVNTQDATLGHAFSAEQIQSLPLEARNAVEILTLQPGVVFVGNNPAINPDADSRSGAVNGARSDQTNVTIDGIDDNDQLHGYAFTGAMRPTLDSLQEFRVITSNANADAGRSSGAQVALITKSGTNSFHGSLYEYHRPTFVANDWFNLHEQSRNGLPNRPGRFIRNTFGASVGGPIKKDRLFFFANYEGQRKREDTQITRTVPSADLRNGIIHYITCPTAPNCSSGDASNTVVTLNSLQIASMDNCTNTCPMGRGPDPAVMAVMQQYPLPNTDQVGDGFNVRGITFSAAAPAKLDTYITKLDYNLTANGNHRLFLRGEMQNDHVSGVGSDGPQFPGDPPNHILRDNTKGMIGGYTAAITTSLINNLRYGYVRQGTSQSGLSNLHHVNLGGGYLDDPLGFSREKSVQVPMHNLADDLTWTRRKHTLQFGGAFRMINNFRISTENSFFRADTNPGFLATTGLANKRGSLDPAVFHFPAVANFFAASYDFPMTALAGLITTVAATYNQTKTGVVLPEGTPVSRHFRAHEGEFYLQDSWRIKPTFTVTAGVRYTLLQPPYETSGTQVAPSVSLNDFFKKRAAAMFAGQTYDPTISLDLSGQANGRAPYWAWDYKDIAPRIALAWAPSTSAGILRKILGGTGKTSIRAGYGIYYDHFGEGIVNTFDRNGSFGLTTVEMNPPNTTPDTAPRFTDLFTIPPTLVIQPILGFPATPPPLFAISWGLDDKLKTPYSHVIDFSVTREVSRSFVFEVAYVGRLAHRLLQEEDLAMPLDIRDPKSGVDYFTAATQFAVMAEAATPTPINKVGPIAYWEDIFPKAAGAPLPNGGCGFPGEGAVTTLSATQAMYDLYACNLHNETTALLNADLACVPACATLNGVTQPNQFFQSQWASLYAWRSIGNSSYHAAQFTLRHRSGGLIWDLNYTLSKSIDIGSNAEHISSFEGQGFWDQIINSWSPNQLRGPSDFDGTHQINSNWVWDLPVGQGKRFVSGMGRLGDALLGGWQLSGLFRWTTGYPYSAHNGLAFATNWAFSGFAMVSGKLPRTGEFIDSDGDPNIFQNKDKARSAFRFPHPGESGVRNNLRGQGFFGVDTGVTKTWKFSESQTLKFNWEVYNVTNTTRFGFDVVPNGPSGAVGFLDIAGGFGKYSQTLNKPRIMEFGLRYSF